MEWQRLELLLKDKLQTIQNKKIIVIGLGGVGSYVVESLVRLGIKTITLVDYDVIDITNINRQLIALHSTIGRKKVEVMQERIIDINPHCHIEILVQKLEPEHLELLFKEVDYVVDACDDILLKKAIIRTCTSNSIPFIACMATGNKLDPTALEITDIRKTTYDPLAKVLRKMVRDEKIKGKVPVVTSREKPIKHEEKVIGSCSFVPSVAGLLCTSYIVNDIVGEIDE